MASVRERQYASGLFWEGWYNDRQGKRRAFNTKIAVAGPRSQQAALELTLTVQAGDQAGVRPLEWQSGPHSPKPLFAGLWMQFVADKRLTVRAGTVGLYEQTGRAWLGCMDNAAVGEIGPAMLRTFAERRLRMAGKKGRMTAETVNRQLRDLHVFLRWCHARGYVPKVPASFQLKTEQKLPLVLRPEQVERLLAAGKKRTLAGVRFDVFLRILLFSGLRVAEAVSLEWDDVDVRRRVLAIGGARTKTGKQVTVPLSQPLVAALRELPKPRRGRLVPWSATSGHVRSVWAEICRDAGVRYQKLHSWRHTAATMMVEAGLKPHQLKEILHASLQTTLKYYVGADREAVADAARRIGKSRYGKL